MRIRTEIVFSDKKPFALIHAPVSAETLAAKQHAVGAAATATVHCCVYFRTTSHVRSR